MYELVLECKPPAAAITTPADRLSRSEVEPAPVQSDEPSPVYATEGLIAVLCELAADAEPQEVSIPIAATAAGDLDDVALSASTPVFTDFYLPDVGGSVSAVFGVDLGVPAGQTHGRFLSHPSGDPSVSLTDDLAATMLVAVPPWEPGDVAVYDRGGQRLELVLVDAEPPEKSLA